MNKLQICLSCAIVAVAIWVIVIFNNTANLNAEIAGQNAYLAYHALELIPEVKANITLPLICFFFIMINLTQEYKICRIESNN